MKILILKPSSLGDVVQALPVLRLLKLHHPSAEIYWWVETRNAPLLEGDPDLAGVFRFERDRWARPWNWGEMCRSILQLRQHRFDLILDLQALARTGAIGWLANGEYFVGLHDARELAPGYYDLSVPRPSQHTHAVDWYIEVLRALQIPVHHHFDWLPRRAALAQEVESIWALDDRPLIGLLPGARWENKRWPVEHFAQLIRELHVVRGDLRFAILGGKSDSVMAHAIAAVRPEACLDLTGRTSLPQMVELIRRCDVVVTNDTGPMHVAAALGRPVVGIFGPTHPARTGPYQQTNHVLQRKDLPCVPCMKAACAYREPLACVRGIGPGSVADRVLALLRRPAAPPPGSSPDCMQGKAT